MRIFFKDNAFLILAVISALGMCFSALCGLLFFTVAFGVFTIVCALLGIYFITLEEFDDGHRREEYEKAHYHQARKNTLKIVKGKSDEST